MKAIRVAEGIASRDNTITIRRAPAHVGVEGNEQASLSHLTRKMAEARSEATARWIRDHSGRRRRYQPPKDGKMRKALNRIRKEVAGHFYQLLSGRAVVAKHLVRVN